MPASRASFASGSAVMPMTSAPQRRYSSDSARVENAGPSMTTSVPPRCASTPAPRVAASSVCAEARAERRVEGDVRDDAAAEERRWPRPRGAVDELVRHDDVQRRDLFLQAADGADGDDATRRRATPAPRCSRAAAARRAGCGGRRRGAAGRRVRTPSSVPSDDRRRRARRTACRRATRSTSEMPSIS